MHIHWSVTKKRGCYRPVLHVVVTYEPEEEALRAPALTCASSYIKGMSHYHASSLHSPPGINEDNPQDPIVWFYVMWNDCHMSREYKYALPLRENLEYPEIPLGMQELRDAIEQNLIRAAELESLLLDGKLELSVDAKQRISPAILELVMEKNVEEQKK